MATWAYRLKDGEVEAQLFETDEVPKGWHDSPAKCVKRGRPKKDDDK